MSGAHTSYGPTYLAYKLLAMAAAPSGVMRGWSRQTKPIRNSTRWWSIMKIAAKWERISDHLSCGNVAFDVESTEIVKFSVAQPPVLVLGS